MFAAELGLTPLPDTIWDQIMKNYISLSYSFVDRPLRQARIPKTFDDFTDNDCFIRFRFRKDDLPRLLRAFRMEGVEFRASNRVQFSPEEILMIGLGRFATTGSLHVALSRLFGLEFSQLSRAVGLFVAHMLPICKRFLTDNMEY
jgi:hypothetical protein